MAANLGTYLGLVGAALVVMLGAKYVNKRMKKEVKVYGEGQISVAEERKAKPDGRADVSPDNREQSLESQGDDAGRDRVQDTTSAKPKSDRTKSGAGGKADKSNRVNLSRITPI